MEPWAFCILRLGKRCENRNWYSKHRGAVALCTSKKVEPGWDEESWDDLLAEMFGAKAADLPNDVLFWDPSRMFVPGHCVGVMEFVGCDKEMKTPWDCRDQWHFRIGRVWRLSTPFPVKGALGLWDIDREGKKTAS